MTTALNCLLLGLSVIGAARVALRDRSPGWGLLTLAFLAIFAHGLADRETHAEMATHAATLANALILGGLVMIYHDHRRETLRMQQETKAIIRRLDEAQRRLRGDYGTRRT